MRESRTDRVLGQVRPYTVIPALPERLAALRKIAYNLWWTWQLEARNLFRRLDEELWLQTEHNPVRLLQLVPQERLEQLLDDWGFLAHTDRVERALDAYLSARTWFQREHPEAADYQIAYFSLEYGLHECLPLYSGGMGVVAGDHLKSASDLGLPLVGVGLLYRQGFFRQRLDRQGYQSEYFPRYDFSHFPLRPAQDRRGNPVTIEHEFPGPVQVKAQVWQVQVGRVPLYLLDTDLPENPPEGRAITQQLYGGDSETRIRQEILLGLGGLRALEALGCEPDVCHMNEGHSAFLVLERARVMVKRHVLSFHEAREAIRCGNVFTIHTALPAGHERFPRWLIEKYLTHYLPPLGLGLDKLLALGRLDSEPEAELFSMTVLALRMSQYKNGVSRLHERTSRRMWAGVWPKIPLHESPIGSITNGVHVASWLARPMAALFDRYLGVDWRERTFDHRMWARVENIPDGELWRVHARRRRHVLELARQRAAHTLALGGAPREAIARLGEVFDPEILTIGCGRRAAAYKRNTLLFRDPERLARLLSHPARPMQLLFAGKAHPQDETGKRLIQELVAFQGEARFRGRLLFLADYDLNLARAMVQGVDVWLNTPRRPHEASGVSGMKAAVNGVLHLSVLDGWWDEGFAAESGWAIGQGEEYPEADYPRQDAIEAEALYNLLEKEIAPLFYERDQAGVPRGWVARMKAAMRSTLARFNSERMVGEYLERFYLPAAQRRRHLVAENLRSARQLSEWRAALEHYWPEVRVLELGADAERDVPLGHNLQVTAHIHLGRIKPPDVTVELCHGPLATHDAFASFAPVEMNLDSPLPAARGAFRYRGHIPTSACGRFGYTVRIIPRHRDLEDPLDTGLISWAE